MINYLYEKIDWLADNFRKAEPFNHIIIDDFWTEEVAEELYNEFPKYDATIWNAHYNNAIENKKACNHWDKFPRTTYKAFNFLGSKEFTDIVRNISGRADQIGRAHV